MNSGDLTKNPLNLIEYDRPKSIFDPNSEWMRELEIYKLKSEIKPRKVNMMQSQAGMLKDMAEDRESKRLYVPTGNGGFVR